MQCLYYQSPIGNIELQLEKEHLVSLCFTSNNISTDDSHPFITQLKEYFEGTRNVFEIPTRLEGTVFQKQVWSALTKLPFGEVKTYTDIAHRVDRPEAVRAVGTAIGKNPIGIIIPCHRVKGKSGLGGFAWGLDKKMFLLQHEESSKSFDKPVVNK